MNAGLVLATSVVLVPALRAVVGAFRRTSRTLRRSRSQLKAILDASPLAVYLLDREGRIQRWSDAAEQMFGWREEEVLGGPVPTVPRDKWAEFQLVRERVLSGEVLSGVEGLQFRKDGSPISVSLSAAPVREGSAGITGMVALLDDITERRQEELRLQHLAIHDPLTNLLNRAALIEQLERLMSRSSPQRRGFLMLLDVDNFTMSNSLLARSGGDHILRQLADLLVRSVPLDHMVARAGGDQFAILMESADEQPVLELGDRLLQEVRQHHFEVDGRRVDLAVSIGIAAVDEPMETSAVELLVEAALHEAKDRGRNQSVLFHPKDAVRASPAETGQWAARIRQALEEQRFLIYFQPMVRLDSGETEHYEALIRMENPAGEVLPPGAFLPAAERMGLMPEIDRWVVASVLDYLADHPSVQMFVNLSGPSLNDQRLIEMIDRRLEELPDLRHRLGFEVTEAVAIRDFTITRRSMKHLRDQGCRFALDDFGTGFCSLAYLRALPADFVKVDGSFVRNMHVNPYDTAIVRAISDLSHAFDKQVIAEWVESEEVARTLRHLGIDLGQGHYWGARSATIASGSSS